MDSNEQPKRHRRWRRRPEPATLHDFVQPNGVSVKILSLVERPERATKQAVSPDTGQPTRHTSQPKRRSRIKTAILRSREPIIAHEESKTDMLPSMRFRVRHLVQTDELEDPDELQDLVDDLTAQFEAFDGFAALRVIVNEEDEELELHEACLEPGDVVVTYDTSEKAEPAFGAYLGKRYGGLELECWWLHEANAVSNQREGNANTNEPMQTLESNLGQVLITQATANVPSPLLAAFLQRLAALQERAHQQNPLHDVRLKRLVLGLNEVQRNITTKRLRLLFVANNIESCDELENKMTNIMDLARKNEIPVIQSLSRRQLGKYLSRNVRVSCVGVCSIDGANEYFQEIMSHIRK